MISSPPISRFGGCKVWRLEEKRVKVPATAWTLLAYPTLASIFWQSSYLRGPHKNSGLEANHLGSNGSIAIASNGQARFPQVF
jgi:hypothetical protein